MISYDYNNEPMVSILLYEWIPICLFYHVFIYYVS